MATNCNFQERVHIVDENRKVVDQDLEIVDSFSDDEWKSEK